MGFWENTTIGKFFGPRKEKIVIDGMAISKESDVFALESFSIGSSVSSYYHESTKFVELQEKNFILNNVISKIAQRLSNAVFTDEKDSVLLNKINNPNNFQSKEEFLKEFAVFILSSGWTAIWKRYVSYGNFDSLELININPDKATPDGENITFEYEDKSITIALTDVIFFYDVKRNPKTKKGYSRSTPLKSQLQNISLAQKAKNIQIQNSGTTIVSPKQVSAGNGIDEGLNAPIPTLGTGLKTQKDEMEDKLNNRGLENRIIVSSKGLDAVNLSEKLNKIDFYKIIEADAISVYDAYGFPIELSPHGPNAKFDNKEVAELSLYENEVIPLANNLTSTLNAEFPNKGKINAGYGHIGCMSIIRNKTIDTNQKLINQYGYLLEKEAIDLPEFKKMLTNNNIIDGPAKKTTT